MNIKEMKIEDAVCWECKGKPDYAYFNDHSGDVLAVICKSCREAFSATISAMAKSFHGPDECDECNSVRGEH